MNNDLQVENILDSLGWKWKRAGKAYLIHCPFAPQTHKSGEDRHPSFILWPGIQYGKCYSCGRGGDFAALFGQAIGQTVDLELMGIKASLEQEEKHDLQFLSTEEAPFDAVRSHAEAIEFLRRRGFDLSCIDHFALLFDPHKSAIVFPVFHRERLVGYVGRSTREKRHFNYFNVPTGQTLGGTQKFTDNKKLAIVEGFTDILNCYQWANDLGFDVACTWTANMTPEQATIAADTGKVIHCWYDQDDAGHRGFRKIEKLLEDSDYGLTRAVWPDRNLDVGAMNRETFYSIFSR